jgi:hypothetical protein
MTGRRVSIKEILGRSTIHPFPARMAPGLALAELKRLRAGALVVDPMSGSGTVVALGRAHGHRCIGVDVDPLAVLTSRVWTRATDRDAVRRRAQSLLAKARKGEKKMAQSCAYPEGADKETRKFIRYWFDPIARRQLAALSLEIRRVRQVPIREALWCAFSRLIVAKQAGVSLALDLAHSRPHRAFVRAPKKPFPAFIAAVERVLEGLLDSGAARLGPKASIELGDARRLRIKSDTVDLVVTSPPYLNAIDYLRCSKFSLVWMGHSIESLRTIRSESIGAEVGQESSNPVDRTISKLQMKPALPPRFMAMLRRYVSDTSSVMNEVSRILRSNGRAIFVVGENTIRGTFVPTGKLVSQIGQTSGLRLLRRQTRTLPENRRYLPPPRGQRRGLGSRMRREVILTFRRPGPRTQI